MRPCGDTEPHESHLYVREEDSVPTMMPVNATLTQDMCPGVPVPPPPLHGHGGGSHPDACFDCWKLVQHGA